MSIGGGTALNSLMGLIRGKALAMAHGPAATGVVSIYATLVTFSACLAGLGINSSARRQIAIAQGSGDERRIHAVDVSLRRITWLLAILGAAVLAATSPLTARAFFAEGKRTLWICLLGLAVALTILNDTQLAVIRGRGLIGPFVKANIFGGLLGTALALPLLALGEAGLALFVCAPALGLAISARLQGDRLVDPSLDRVSWAETRSLFEDMAPLGLTLMTNALVNAAGMFFVKMVIAGRLGVENVGFFQAAWSLSVGYILIVLSAVSNDFYPKIAGLLDDTGRVNALTNRQIEVTMLLLGPLLLLMATFSSTVLSLLYTGSFAVAARLLGWQLLGTVFRAASWPLRFQLVAYERKRMLLVSELMWNVILVAGIGFGASRFGIDACGMAYAAASAAYLALAFFGSRAVTGYSISPTAAASMVLPAIGIASILLTARFSSKTSAGVGSVLSLAAGAWSWHVLRRA
jgi:O-antigen/teichoic acid export membrane protein